MVLNRGNNIIKDMYVGFCFHEGAFDNWKLLNSLKKVIPNIHEFIAHEGLIRVKTENQIHEFSGETTEDIIETLVKERFNIK